MWTNNDISPKTKINNKINNKKIYYEIVSPILKGESFRQMTVPIISGKKLIGNKDPAFIKKRRKELETYLQSVFNFLKHSLPSCLVTFLQFPSYDLHHILRAISSSYVKVRRPALVWAINNIIDFSNMHFCQSLECVMVQGTVDR